MGRREERAVVVSWRAGDETVGGGLAPTSSRRRLCCVRFGFVGDVVGALFVVRMTESEREGS